MSLVWRIEQNKILFLPKIKSFLTSIDQCKEVPKMDTFYEIFLFCPLKPWNMLRIECKSFIVIFHEKHESFIDYKSYIRSFLNGL